MGALTSVPSGVSVVTTTWNEHENISELIRRIRAALAGIPHEIIVVDDSSTDGTLQAAQQVADIAISKPREGQSKGLLYGMRLAKYSTIVTIDADLENDPALIPVIIDKLRGCDLAVASRTIIPRFSERFASKTLGKAVGASDFYSNFRAYKKAVVQEIKLKRGETFGGELLVRAKKQGFKICELTYQPSPRRSKPRIGGTIRANLRISIATIKCAAVYLARKSAPESSVMDFAPLKQSLSKSFAKRGFSEPQT